MLRDRPVTVYGVATALARSPEQVAAMQAAGWEIASHGLKWIDYRDIPEDQERADLAEAIRLHTEVTGARPEGFYLGRTSMNTVRLAAEEGGFAYLADSYADDLPYWVRLGGRDQLIVPYTLDANDMRFATPQGFNSGDQFETYLRDSFDCLHAEGVAGAPKMLSIGLHCRLVGRPGRAAALKRVLDYMAGHEGVWFATRLEIARHWAEVHPVQTRTWAQNIDNKGVSERRVEDMDRDAFVAAFGGVFEHSPWVAEAAWALELGPAHDSAAGLHSALVRAFRSGSAEDRLGVLRAHPDLAGKLAQARRLTRASSAEQASAGLDALTDDERAEFTRLNDTYTAKFGFPFIIAVRDHDKSGILDAFRRRADHDRETEIAEAARQVERIAELRLRDMLGR